MSELYKYDLDDRGVATITLNRPDIHNAFNDELILELTNKFNAMNSDDSVRLVVLTGEGKSFCAGADLNWMKKMKDYTDEENYNDSKRLSEMFEAMNNFTKPLIGKVNGAALGGGVGLVAVCDYVIAQEESKFGLTEVRLGLVPAVISPYVIAKIGESNARATFLTGERFDEKRAMELGLVHQTSLKRHFAQDVDKVVENFLKAGPSAQIMAKELVRGVVYKHGHNREELMDFTCKMIAKARTTDEGQEGMAALLEKRKPSWMK